MAEIDWNALPDAAPAAQPSTPHPTADALQPAAPQQEQVPGAPNWDSLPNANPQIVSAQKYGTPGQKLKTLVEGAAAGPTFGLSRELESKVLNNAQEQKARQEQNPGLATIGELGGILAAPETGLVGAVGRAGKAVEKVASPIVEKILGSTVGKLGAKAAGSAIEGGFWGAGTAVDEDALGDADLNASNIMHNVGYGALWGGTLGTALGIGGKAFSREAQDAAQKEMHVENALNMPERPAPAAPSSMEELEQRNALGTKLGFGSSLPAKQAVIDAQQSLVGDMNFLPHGAQIASLETPEARKAYDALLKGDNDTAKALRQYQTNQKYEGSQELLPRYIQDIAPDEALATDATKGGQAAIDDFTKQYEANKIAESQNFNKLDAIQTTSVANPQDVLKGIFEDMPGAKNLLGVRADGSFFTRPWEATSGIEKGTYGQFKEIVKALNKDGLSIGEVRNLRETMRDMASDWTKPSQAAQVSALRKHLMSYMQDEIQKVLPDAQVRDFMRRYAVNEQNRGIIENIFGGSLSDKAKFGKAIEPEKVLPRIFSKLENVRAAKELLGDSWNKTVANFLSHVHDSANDPIKGFSSNNFSKTINDVKTGRGLIMDEALQGSPEKLQKIRDVTTVLRALPDAPPGNPSGTAETLGLLEKARKWTSAFLHPTQILGHIGEGVGNALDARAQRTAVDKMLNARDAATFDSKAEKYNAFGKIERMQQSTIGTIKNGIKQILNPEHISGAKGLLTQKLTPEDQQKKFDKIASQIKEITTNPELALNKVANATKDFGIHAPTLAAKVGGTMMAAANFLASKLPAQDAPSIGTKPYQPSSTELARFNRYYNTVNKPLSILKELDAGIVTQEGLEAMQAVHPKLLQSMQSELLDQFTSHKDTGSIPYKKRLAMSMFLGQDLTNSLKSENIASAQLPNAAQAPPQQNGAPQKRSNQIGLGKLDKSSQTLTDFQSANRRTE